MRKLILFVILSLCLTVPVSAAEFTAPPAPEEVEDLISADTESFGEGLWKIVKEALEKWEAQNK